MVLPDSKCLTEVANCGELVLAWGGQYGPEDPRARFLPPSDQYQALGFTDWDSTIQTGASQVFGDINLPAPFSGDNVCKIPKTIFQVSGHYYSMQILLKHQRGM